jgi:hypothetical protein
VTWITLTNPSGNGDAALVFTVNPNAAFVGRIGVITIQWSGGGQAQLTVRQAYDTPAVCLATITVGGQNPFGVPVGGGQYTASIAPVLGVPPGACGPWTASAYPAMTFVGSTSGLVPGSVTFTVPPNLLMTARTWLVTINFVAGNLSAVLTINQSGGP